MADFLHKYDEVLTEELGTVHPFTAELSMASEAKPKFCKARPVSYALREAVGEEPDHLESTGVLERVDHSKWAAPVVTVPKKDGSVGTIKWESTRHWKLTSTPLLKPEDLFATLAGGQKFTTLDLSHLYNSGVARFDETVGPRT